MPLHLLSKKSWNVYNPAAIAKVRADEADAAAREEAEDQRQDAYEADCRLATLRGLPLPEPPRRSPSPSLKRSRHENGTKDPRDERPKDDRKRRRIHGEDDTDRDIRFARQDKEQREGHRTALPPSKKHGDMPLIDHAGHIQLFAPPSVKEIRTAKDAEVEHKKLVKATAEEGAMRFSDAAGFKTGIKDLPWYATGRGFSGTEDLDPNLTHGDDTSTAKDAFGRDDPGRVRRDAARLNTTDPMAMMSRAQKQLKDVQRERDKWQKDRERELKELKILQEEERRRRRRSGKVAIHALPEPDEFRLDALDTLDTHGRTPRQDSHPGGHRHRHQPPYERRDSSRETMSKSNYHTSTRHRSRSRDRHRSPIGSDSKTRQHSSRSGNKHGY